MKLLLPLSAFTLAFASPGIGSIYRPFPWSEASIPEDLQVRPSDIPQDSSSSSSAGGAVAAFQRGMQNHQLATADRPPETPRLYRSYEQRTADRLAMDAELARRAAIDARRAQVEALTDGRPVGESMLTDEALPIPEGVADPHQWALTNAPRLRSAELRDQQRMQESRERMVALTMMQGGAPSALGGL